MPHVARRLWLAKLALLAVSLLVAVLMIEVLLRVTGRDRPLLWEPDPTLGWRHIPHARQHWVEEGDGRVQINALGFRDAERNVAKPTGVFRIAVFGDSTTEAVQVNLDQTFTQLLEARLRRCGLDAEVLNFGVSGYGPLQDYLLYSQRGRTFHPDLVLLATFLDNDVADGDRRLAPGQRGAPFLEAASEGEFEIDDSAAVSSATSYQSEPIHTVRRFSALYRVLRAGQSGNLAQLAAVDATQQVPKRFLLYADPLGVEWNEAWETFERVVAKFADTVKQDGVAFAVLSMPAGQVVDPEVWSQLTRDYPAMASRTWDVLSAETRLRAVTERHRIPLIAPLETFKKAASSGPLFFNRIGHLTPRGHEVMAEALETALAERKLVTRVNCGGS